MNPRQQFGQTWCGEEGGAGRPGGGDGGSPAGGEGADADADMVGAGPPAWGPPPSGPPPGRRLLGIPFPLLGSGLGICCASAAQSSPHSPSHQPSQQRAARAARPHTFRGAGPAGSGGHARRGRVKTPGPERPGWGPRWRLRNVICLADVACPPPPLRHPPPPRVCHRRPSEEETAMAATTASRLSPPRFHVRPRSPHPPPRRSRYCPVRAAKYAPFLDPHLFFAFVARKHGNSRKCFFERFMEKLVKFQSQLIFWRVMVHGCNRNLSKESSSH